MKKLTIIRHAKSSWGDLLLSDRERPLNNRGNRDAPIMANYLKIYGVKPQRIIASTSQRTRETAQYFLDTLDLSQEDLGLEKQLYLGSENDFLDTMYGISEDIDSVMMIGHNPGLTYIANLCSEEFIDNVPTCGVLIIEMNIDNWTEADWDKAILKQFLYPKML